MLETSSYYLAKRIALEEDKILIPTDAVCDESSDVSEQREVVGKSDLQLSPLSVCISVFLA